MTIARITPALRSLAAAALAGAGLTFAPIAVADPDPHIPNGWVGWCPGGQDPSYCLGEAFPDGTFFAQSRLIIASQPFRGPQWQHYASCRTWVNGQLTATPGCGGLGEINI